MSAFAAYFASGRAADIVLLAMAAEALMLIVAGRDVRSVVLALLPGALLVLALRAALTGAAWPWIALPLTLSLPVHILYLRDRGWFGTDRASHGLSRQRSRRPRRGIWARMH